MNLEALIENLREEVFPREIASYQLRNLLVALGSEVILVFHTFINNLKDEVNGRAVNFSKLYNYSYAKHRRSQ